MDYTTFFNIMGAVSAVIGFVLAIIGCYIISDGYSDGEPSGLWFGLLVVLCGLIVMFFSAMAVCKWFVPLPR